MKKKSKNAPASCADLARILIDQPLCCHKAAIAHWLAANGARLEVVPKRKLIIKEGDKNNRDVFFIATGRVEVKIGGHPVGERGKNWHVGEMAMIMGEPRTASVYALEPTTLVRVPEASMERAYKRYPEMWEPVAKTLCDRLHERRKFFRARNKQPKIFVGSSGTRKFVANALADQLRLAITGEVRVWSDDQIFCPSDNILEKLIRQSKECDFGIFIFGADDKVKSKGTRFAGPRDNVILEGGMFTASCGICRTFFVCEDVPSMKIPTDLNGIRYLKFKAKVKAKTVDCTDAVREIAAAIKKLKVVV